MLKKSFIYLHPTIYELGISMLYFDALKILKDIIGHNKTVLELASGYGRNIRYIYPDCSYSGFDLNKSFVNYAKKKGRDISLGNIFDEKNYKSVDIILLCDILHHLKNQEIENLLLLSTKYVKEKIVIIEPQFVKIASKKNIFSKIFAKVFSIIDYDGINKIENWLSEKEYYELFNKLKKQNKIKEISIKKFRKHFFVQMIKS